MDEQTVIDTMEDSQSAEDWNANADKVKEACNGYPDFWWASIIKSGRADRIMARWGGSSQLSVTIIPGNE